MLTTKEFCAKPLLQLTAADLMSAPVVSILQDMLLREAGLLLRRSCISGAPVVDLDGHCVGILSSSDFIGWAEAGGRLEEKRAGVRYVTPCGEIISLDACEDCTVRQYMTKDPVTVSINTPIGEIAQKMVDAHIHRILVANDQGPIGIVSSTDIVAALANAAKRSSHIENQKLIGIKAEV